MAFAVILAAGAATRFGSSKQLAEFEGATLIERAVRCAVEAGLTPIVVVGANAEAVARQVDGHRVVHNERWSDGMGTSIAVGVRAARDLGAEQVVVMPVDVPGLRADDLRHLVEARVRAEADASAARYDEVIGIPACFGPSCYDSLSALHGDVGARQWLRGGEWNVVAVPMERAADDVDQPSDLETREG